MFTNASCTIYNRDGGRTVFENVYWEASKGMNANDKSREPKDKLLLIIPTNQKLDIQIEDEIFEGITENIPLNELKNRTEVKNGTIKFYKVTDVKPFLFGLNPHYEITGG